jgi:hypothetical protein
VSLLQRLHPLFKPIVCLHAPTEIPCARTAIALRIPSEAAKGVGKNI